VCVFVCVCVFLCVCVSVYLLVGNYVEALPPNHESTCPFRASGAVGECVCVCELEAACIQISYSEPLESIFCTINSLEACDTAVTLL
jgi:hypothetical protein